MKSNLNVLAIVTFLGFFLYSCSSDDDNGIPPEAPVISSFEYGEGSTHSTDPVAYKGGDIHTEAEINAEAVVESITIRIHAHDLTPAEGEEEWVFEHVYTDSKYQVINPELHEHIDVPENAPAGEYHIELIVTDQQGNSTESDGNIQILDPEASISLSDIGIDESAARGSDIHAEFMIHAVHGIHGISVDIHAHGLTVGEGETEWTYNNTFSEGYHGKTEVEFHEHIDVPATAPAGEYHAVFAVEDENGNIYKHDTHIEVTK